MSGFERRSQETRLSETLVSMATQEKFGWGLIGTGRHANRFIAPAINKSQTSRLIAIYSRDRTRGSDFAAKHHCAAAYDSLDDLLRNEKVQAVFVCSPNHAHKDHVVRAAGARKHVLCEKPLAPTAAECREMIAACGDAGVRLAVAFNLRHNPVHLAAREAVRSGKLGNVILAEAQYMHVTSGATATRASAPWRRDVRLAGGGSFLSTGVHVLDLLRFVLGKEVAEVSALAGEEWSRTGIERLIQVSLMMQGNLISQLSAGSMKYPQNHLVVYGSAATLRCTGSIGNYGGGLLEVTSDEGTETQHYGPCDVYEREMDTFVAGLNGGDDTSATGHDGYEAARVTEAVYESLKKGMTIKVDRPAAP